MKISPQPLRESRLDVIRRHVPRVLAAGQKKLSLESWSDDVLAAWDALLAPEFGAGRWSRNGDPYKRWKANGQSLRRLLSDDDAEGHIPATEHDLDVLVLAMLRGGYTACAADLTLRFGGLFVLMGDGAAAAVSGAAELLRETGEAVSELAPLLADGRIDGADCRERLMAARRALLDVPACVHALVAQIDRAMAEQQTEGSAEPRLRAVS